MVSKCWRLGLGGHWTTEGQHERVLEVMELLGTGLWHKYIIPCVYIYSVYKYTAPCVCLNGLDCVPLVVNSTLCKLSALSTPTSEYWENSR